MRVLEARLRWAHSVISSRDQGWSDIERSEASRGTASSRTDTAPANLMRFCEHLTTAVGGDGRRAWEESRKDQQTPPIKTSRIRPVEVEQAGRVINAGRISSPRASLRNALGLWSVQRLLLACAVKRRRFPVGANPTRQPLQPEATGAGNQDSEAYRQGLPWGDHESPGRNESERASGLENEWIRGPSLQPKGEGSMGCRNLTDAASRSRRGGSDSTVARTCRATGEALLVPERNHRSKVDCITGTTGKTIEGERVADGSVVAMKRSNVRGAKGPCCL